MKPLHEMSLQELWKLFPITLARHNDAWGHWAEDEIAILSSRLVQFAPNINHIGSTAIPGIAAKPIIDILVEMPPGADWQLLRATLECGGYICMSSRHDRMSFNKGYTPAGYAPKVFHIHIRNAGDNDELAFRDYLRSHPEAAREYEALKQSLLPAFRNNRDAYTEAKTDFVTKIVSLAKCE